MHFFRETDAVVIGSGDKTAMILRELSGYNLRCIVLEEEPEKETYTLTREDGVDRYIPDVEAQIVRNCKVTGFVRENGVVTIVNTTKGAIMTRILFKEKDFRSTGYIVAKEIEKAVREEVREKIIL